MNEKNKKAYEGLLSFNDLKAILDGDSGRLVSKAESIASKTQEGPKDKRLSSSQIRNVYGTVKKMEMTWDSQKDIGRLILLKPKLAYAAGRNPKIKGLALIKDVLSDSIDLVAENTEKRFDNFCRFFEAILAYHRAEGGK